MMKIIEKNVKMTFPEGGRGEQKRKKKRRGT